MFHLQTQRQPTQQLPQHLQTPRCRCYHGRPRNHLPNHGSTHQWLALTTPKQWDACSIPTYGMEFIPIQLRPHSVNKLQQIRRGGRMNLKVMELRDEFIRIVQYSPELIQEVHEAMADVEVEIQLGRTDL